MKTQVVVSYCHASWTEVFQFMVGGAFAALVVSGCIVGMIFTVKWMEKKDWL